MTQSKTFDTILRRFNLAIQFARKRIVPYTGYIVVDIETEFPSAPLTTILVVVPIKKLNEQAHVSRSLKPAERNYPAHKLEFLFLKWTVMDKFYDYLYGAEFEVATH